MMPGQRRTILPRLAFLAVVTLTLPGHGHAQTSALRSGTLVVAISADPGHLNPAITTSGATHTAAELIYNGLLGRDERGDPMPDLAESWAIEQSGAAYRFRLRDGVTWHDGARFTAADVKFTFEEVLLKFHARTKASMGSALAGIEAPDDRTVVFRFKQPYAPLLHSSTPPKRRSSPDTSTRAAIRRRTRPTPVRSAPGPSSSSRTRRAPRSVSRGTPHTSSEACQISTRS